VTTNPVWVFADPSVDSEVFGALLTGVPVTIVSQYGDWVEIIWQEGSERIQGWVGLRWLNLNVTIPPERITPASPGEQAP
jgi:SH3-like domain-containing protein